MGLPSREKPEAPPFLALAQAVCEEATLINHTHDQGANVFTRTWALPWAERMMFCALREEVTFQHRQPQDRTGEGARICQSR